MYEVFESMNIEKISHPHLFIGLLILILFDIITGVTNAILQQELQSTKLRLGVTGKVYEIGLVGIGLLLDKLFHINCLYISLCIFYISQEGISILENTGKYITYPKIVRDVFEKLKSFNKGE